jgi:hypothetical protein
LLCSIPWSCTRQRSAAAGTWWSCVCRKDWWKLDGCLWSCCLSFDWVHVWD